MIGGVRTAARAAVRALALLLCASAATNALAQRSIVRGFDVADGLPSSRVSSIVEDARGYLWISTWQGIARFDGREFRVYGEAQGLPRSIPNEVREDARGRLWVACNGDGVARLDDDPARGGARFRVFAVGSDRRHNTVNALAFEGADRMLLGTEGGLVRASALGGEPVFEPLDGGVACLKPQAACRDGDGAAWFVGAAGLARVGGGRVETTPLAEPSRTPEYLCVAARSPGELLVGDDRTLWRFDAAARGWAREPLELATNQGIRTLLVDARGDLWIGTTSGLLRVRAGRALHYTTEQGLPDNSIRCALEDRGGRLWFGTWLGGIAELGRDGTLCWPRSPEMPNPDVIAVFATSGGRVLASTVNDGLFELGELGARRLGAALSPRFDRVWSRLVEVPGAGWLVGTADELCVVAGAELDLARARPLGADEGCAGIEPIELLLADSAGSVLLADRRRRVLEGRVEVDGSARFAVVVGPEDLPMFDPEVDDAVRALARAPDGTLWVAGRRTLARRVGERFERVAPAPGLPATDVRAFLFDRRERLWIALRHDGVSRCDDPGAAELRWTSIGALAGRECFALAEDPSGHVFVGSWTGVHQLDADGKLVRHYTRATGLVSDFVNALAVDAGGALWVATSGGVTRLDPRAESEREPVPAAWIERVEVDGEALASPARGARSLGPWTLPREPDTLVVEYGAPWLASASPLAFQVRLSGDGAWSPPRMERHVRFARPAAGEHRFEVRAVLAGSGDAGEPASVAFTIPAPPPPLWRRPWFVVLAGSALAGAALTWHRVRLRQALALERVRSQIALDLHDELGADLTQVAILAEVARRGAARAEGDALEKVAVLARGMRESLADIVWSVDPRRDRVGDLVVRLRQVGNRLVEAGGIELGLAVDAERPIEELALAPDERRGLYLIAKESLHNAVKHSGARRIDVELGVRGNELVLAIRDDGCGFDPGAAHAGHGLRSLRSRAAALGARLALRSGSGHGTAVELALRLRGPA